MGATNDVSNYLLQKKRCRSLCKIYIICSQAGISKHPFTVLDQRKLKTSAFCAKPSGKLSHQGVNITDFIPANIRKNQTNYKFHTGQQAVKTNEKGLKNETI